MATWRLIDGEWRLCHDIGCDDFERAKRNREMVANKEFIDGYYEIENSLDNLPTGVLEPSREYQLEDGDLVGFEFIDSLSEPLTIEEMIELAKGEPDD